jgi:phosphoribosylformylglycinamidine synthase
VLPDGVPRPLADLFVVAGDGRDGLIVCDGDFSRVHRLAAGMRRGTMHVRGSVGRHSAEGMSGGTLKVDGAAGDLLAAVTPTTPAASDLCLAPFPRLARILGLHPTAGISCAGADPDIVSLRRLADDPSMLTRAQMLVVAGGFSNADALGAGRMFSLSLQHLAQAELGEFVAAGKPVIGICNGFQTLVRAGLLPGALGHNESGSFQCEWVTLEPQPSHCVWTRGIEAFDCPIAHGEGRYVHPDVTALEAAGQVALRYRRNPNGSTSDIAGVCDPTGTVLGLMPHPENHVIARQHPHHVRGAAGGLGLQLFQRGVERAGAV